MWVTTNRSSIRINFCTGEKFYAYKKWIKYDTPHGKYDYFIIANLKF